MSRYHSVRPKKHKHGQHHQVPQPAAPAQSRKLLLERIEKARTELYKLNNGDVLDTAITRWKRLLQIYDREAEVVLAGEPDKPHRWTVSPSMALRAEKHLEVLLERQAKLLDECHAQAHKIVTELYPPGQEGDSLCPPKQTSAPTAGSEATIAEKPTTAEGGQAATPPIAA